MFNLDLEQIILLILMAPFVLATVAMILVAIVNISRTLYIHIRYGGKYIDKEEF